jgi:hypothetical protein
MFDSLLCLLTFYCLLFFWDNLFCFVKTFGYILLCFPGPSETVRGSNFYDSFYYSILPFVPLWQKGGVIFIFGPGMYFQTGQVIFVPEWPKGEFVSILASFCVWTKSLKCKDVVNKDSTIQSLQVRRIQVPCQPSGWSSHPVQTPICPLFHPSGRHVDRTDLLDRPASSVRMKCSFRPDPILYREVSIPACIRQHHVRTPPSTRSISDFFPNSKKRKINQLSGRCGIPSGRSSP